jgi:cysteine desulfurase/selenocysteine lyase
MNDYDPENYARRFPLLVAKPELVYLDNAAATQRLDKVLDNVVKFYTQHNANVHRGFYEIAVQATEAYESTRIAVAKYLNAKHTEEIIFGHGATEAINLVAHSWSRAFLTPGSEIITTVMEHHSNFLPWQQVAREHSAIFKVCDITEDGELDLEDMERKITPMTKLIAITHASNVLGTINPVEKVIAMAKKVGAHVLVDGAKYIECGTVDVQKMNCDFYVFSANKFFACMGVGVLYGRREVLEQMPPYQLGGGMVELVTENDFTCRKLPEIFEAGTPNAVGIAGLNAAITFMRDFQWDAYANYEKRIENYLLNALEEIPSIKIFGNAKKRVGLYSLVCESVHAHDIAAAMAAKNICVRAGNHCAQPLMRRLRVPATLRASFSIYNSLEHAKKFIEALKWAIATLS